MGFSYIEYPADGLTDTFIVPFQYLDETHVEVFVNDVEVTFTWLSATEVKLDATPADGDLVLVQRTTPLTSRMVDFQNAAKLTEEDLDLSADQLFYATQEAQDMMNRFISEFMIDPNYLPTDIVPHQVNHTQGGVDELDGDRLDVDWNPTYYTPATTPESADTDMLASHLKGIDDEINTINSAVTGKADATHAADHLQSGSDEVDGDKIDIDWNPSYYTPEDVAETDNTDQLSAHLKGIDNSLTSIAALAGGSSLPAGMVAPFAMETPPAGWLECDGSVVSRVTYATLFAAISTRFGAGDGSTTFKLPDLRGEFIRGWAHGSTNDPDKAARTDSGDTTTGDKVGTKQSHQVYSHNHSASASGVQGGSSINTSGGGLDSVGITIGTYGGNETRPRNVYMMYCIKT